MTDADVKHLKENTAPSLLWIESNFSLNNVRSCPVSAWVAQGNTAYSRFLLLTCLSYSCAKIFGNEADARVQLWLYRTIQGILLAQREISFPVNPVWYLPVRVVSAISTGKVEGPGLTSDSVAGFRFQCAVVVVADSMESTSRIHHHDHGQFSRCAGSQRCWDTAIRASGWTGFGDGLNGSSL